MTLENVLNKIRDWILTEGVRLVVGLIVLYFVFKIINLLTKRIEKKIKKRKKALDKTITKVSLSIFKNGLKILSFICFLGYVGIETTSIAAAITSAGLGVGLALQGSLSNFAGGVIILVMRPYKIGDFIKCNDISGTVEDIKSFYTYIVTIDNKVVAVPNGKMVDSSIVNYSSKELRRLDMFFNVEYTADIMKVRKAILQSVKNSNMHKESIEPTVSIEEHNENSIKVILKVWCDNSKYWSLYYYLQEEVIKQFEKYNINIPYNKIKVI